MNSIYTKSARYWTSSQNGLIEIQNGRGSLVVVCTRRHSKNLTANPVPPAGCCCFLFSIQTYIYYIDRMLVVGYLADLIFFHQCIVGKNLKKCKLKRLQRLKSTFIEIFFFTPQQVPLWGHSVFVGGSVGIFSKNFDFSQLEVIVELFVHTVVIALFFPFFSLLYDVVHLVF